MSYGFYRAFEERYRGSRELIKGRLVAYLPFIEPLQAVYPSAAAVDLGCGRGEWLELLSGSGFKPMGVDLDAGMLEDCFDRGFLVEQSDALAYLSTLPNDSQAIVSAFHVVEHITFDYLRSLVLEALRVLKPGGLLILETPNPENIVVATCNFYLDPTHQRPIPPMLLAFVAEYSGFARVKTLRLQESKRLIERDDVSLQDVLAGASPDYAVVAQKYATDEILAFTSNAFSNDYGLSLDSLLSRWDSRFDRLETKAQQAESKAQQAESKAQQAESKAQQAESKAQQAESKAQQAEIALIVVQNSLSWRITHPLRAVNAVVQKGVFGNVTHRILRPFAHWLLRKHKLAALIKRAMRKSEFVMRLARRVVYGGSTYSVSRLPSTNSELRFWDFSSRNCSGELDVEEILSRIRSEIAFNNKE